MHAEYRTIFNFVTRARDNRCAMSGDDAMYRPRSRSWCTSSTDAEDLDDSFMGRRRREWVLKNRRWYEQNNQAKRHE